MQISTYNNRAAEFVDYEVLAADGAGSFTQNIPVCLAVDGNSADGISAMMPAAGNLKSFAGIMRQTTAINGYNLVRAWGYQASCLFSDYGSSVTVTAGDACRPAAGTGLGCSSTVAAITILNTKYVVALSTTSGAGALGALSTKLYLPVLVRAL